MRRKQASKSPNWFVLLSAKWKTLKYENILFDESFTLRSETNDAIAQFNVQLFLAFSLRF